jgi:uncharacterized membrane protein YhiD involved in acid resistance
VLRVGLAFVAGFIVGWEREHHGRSAGLRTNILACVAAAVAMIGLHVLSMKLSYDLEQKKKTFTSELKFSRKQRFEVPRHLAAHLAQAPGVKQIKWG